jgi:hypothetical protein
MCPAEPTRRMAASRELTGCRGQPPGATQDNLTQVEIWDCNGGANQEWAQLWTGALQVYGTKCLDVLGQKTTSGSPVGIFDCNGGGNQKWTIKPDGTIVGVQSGLCLDVTDAKTDNGTVVDVATCTGGSNQRWTH